MLQNTITANTSEEFKKFLECYSHLTSKDRSIMEMRFIEGKTLEEIGTVYNMTKERVRQITENIQRKVSVKSNIKKKV